MTNRTIPCPCCAEIGRCGQCPKCKGSGTIPDRRAPTASEDAFRAEVAQVKAAWNEAALVRLKDIERLEAEVAALKAENERLRLACKTYDKLVEIIKGEL